MFLSKRLLLTFAAFCTAAYIVHGDYNIIIVDWSNISMKPYIWASNHVKIVGEFVSIMIDFLHERGMDLSQTTLVGHSLGAHVVGLAGRKAKGEVGTVIGKFFYYLYKLLLK